LFLASYFDASLDASLSKRNFNNRHSWPIRPLNFGHVHASFLYGIQVRLIQWMLVQEKNLYKKPRQCARFLYKSTCTRFLNINISSGSVKASEGCGIFKNHFIANLLQSMRWKFSKIFDKVMTKSWRLTFLTHSVYLSIFYMLILLRRKTSKSNSVGVDVSQLRDLRVRRSCLCQPRQRACAQYYGPQTRLFRLCCYLLDFTIIPNYTAW